MEGEGRGACLSNLASEVPAKNCGHNNFMAALEYQNFGGITPTPLYEFTYNHKNQNDAKLVPCVLLSKFQRLRKVWIPPRTSKQCPEAMPIRTGCSFSQTVQKP